MQHFGRNTSWKIEKKMKGGMYCKEARIDSKLSNSVINTIVCYSILSHVRC